MKVRCIDEVAKHLKEAIGGWELNVKVHDLEDVPLQVFHVWNPDLYSTPLSKLTQHVWRRLAYVFELGRNQQAREPKQLKVRFGRIPPD